MNTKMRKMYILVIVALFFIFIWFLINYDDITKMNEIHKISQQKEHSLLHNRQQQKLDNYIIEIAEIKVRECSSVANILFIKCGFTDNVGRYALGDKIYNAIINETEQSKYIKYEHKPLFQEQKTKDIEIQEPQNKIYQDYKKEFDEIYSERQKIIQKRQENESR